METNTVLLSLADYNELREFKEKIEEGFTYVSPQPYYHSHIQTLNNYMPAQPVRYITTDMALDELKERNKNLSELNEKLVNEINELITATRFDVTKFERMSIWEFIKWKKNR